ncbi:MAG: serine hydrolase domain-containing protein [Bacteroidia bacterium]
MKFSSFFLGLLVIGLGLSTTGCEPVGINPDDYCKDGKCLDFDTFSQNIQAQCNNQTVGYGFVIYQKGTARKIFTAGLERTDADGGNMNYDMFDKQMIGSVSKTMTALAVGRALDKRGLSLDTKIKNYLPSSWERGANVDNITFRMLMNHTSGFRGCSGCGDNTYPYLKDLVKNGVNLADQTGSYDNANFGIFRVILPYVLGYSPTLFSDIDNETSNMYLHYMQDSLFEVAGVPNSQDVFPKPSSVEPIYSYKFPYNNAKGWLGDDYTKNCGGFGWYMSVMECGVVMREWMESEKIMSKTMRENMLAAGLGIDKFSGQAHGTYYTKRGRWVDGAGNGSNTVVNVFPNNVQVVLFINSDPLNQDIRTLVMNAYDNAWVKPL